jgi:hypothetical protein
MGQLFLDCDGVLADFNSLAESIFGESPGDAEARLGEQGFWKLLEEHGCFYRDLPVLPEGRELFEAVRHLKPIILTGCPKGDWAAPQKKAWGEAHFPGVEVITCLSKNKHDHIRQDHDILVDDFLKYRHLWEEAGGIFVHFTSLRQTLAELTELGLEVRPRELQSSVSQ